MTKQAEERNVDLLIGVDEVIHEAVEVGNVDHNEEFAGGGFDRPILEAGTYPMYLCQYIELGTQKFNGFKGAKDSFDKAVRIGFAVFNYDEVDAEGNPQVVIIDSGYFPLKMIQSPRAHFYQAFKALNYNSDPSMKHMAQFLGSKHTYEGRVTKTEDKKTKGKFYNSIDYISLMPAFTGGRGKDRKREVFPEIPMSDYSIFLWDAPRMAHWDSLRRGAEGVSAGDPNNFLQYSILQASDFEGSALDLMLREEGIDATVQPKKAKGKAAEPEPEEQEEAPPVRRGRTVPSQMPSIPTEDPEDLDEEV